MCAYLAEVDLPGADLRSPGHARRVVESILMAWGLVFPDTLDAARLAISELVTNAVLHGAPQVSVQMMWAGRRLDLAVLDGSAALPEPGHGPAAAVQDVLADDDSAANLGESGRGLLLVRAITDRWTAEPYRDGKRVVATLLVPAAGNAAPP